MRRGRPARTVGVGIRPANPPDPRCKTFPGKHILKMNLMARRLLPMPVVSVAAVGPYEVTMQEAWEHLRTLLIQHDAQDECKPVFALLRDMPHEVPAEKRRLELCAKISEGARRKLENAATIQTFAGGSYLTTTHRGGYGVLPDVFGQMYAACSLDMSIALDAKRPRVLIFSGDPALTPADDLIAELGMPVVDHAPDRPRRVA
jgi:DNA gyrase inhibitor GyrI